MAGEPTTSQTSPETSPQKRRRWPWRITRGLLWTIFWIALVVVLLLFAVLQIARLPAAQEQLRKQILAQTKELLPGLRLGRISGDYTSRLVIEGVVLRDRFGGEAVRLSKLLVEYDLWALVSRRLHVKRIELIEPSLVLRKSKSGKLNLAELVVPTPSKPEPPKAASDPPQGLVRLDSLLIRRGSVRVELDPKRPIIVRDLELDLGARADVKAQRLQLRRLALAVKLPARPPLSIELSVDGALRGAGELSTRQAKLQLNTRVVGALPAGPVVLAVTAQGPLSQAKLTLALSLPGRARLGIAGSAGIDARFAPSFDLRTTLTHLDPSKLLPKLLAGDISLELVTRGHGIPLQAESKLAAELSVKPSRVGPVKVQRLALQAELAATQWTLKQLDLRAGATRITGKGAGTLSRLDRLALTVKAPNLARLPIPVKVPGLGGALDLAVFAKGAFKGPLAATVHARGRDLTVAKLRLGGLQLDAALSGLPKRPRGTLTLRANDFDPGDPKLALSRVAVDLKGNAHRAHVSVEADGKALMARVGADVTLTGKRIQSTLGLLRFSGFGQRLELVGKPAAIDVQPGRRISVAGLRLRTLGGTIAIDGAFRPRAEPRIGASITLRGVRPPRGPRISGTLTAEVRSRVATARGRLRIDGNTTLALDVSVPLLSRRGAPLPHALDKRKPLALRVDLVGLKLAVLRWLAGRKKKLPPFSGRVDLALAVNGAFVDPTTVQLTLGLHEIAALGLKPLAGRVFAEVTPARTRLEVDTQLDARPLLTVRAQAKVGAGIFLRGPLPSVATLAAIPAEVRLNVPEVALQRFAVLSKALKGAQGLAKLDLRLDGSLHRPRFKLSAGLINGKLREQHLGDVDFALQGALEDARTHVTGSLRADNIDLLTLETETQALDPVLLTRKGPGELPLRGKIVLPSFELAQLVRWLPKLPSLGGKLSGEITLAGTSRAPRAVADLRLDGVSLAGTPVGNVQVRGAFDQKKGQADGSVKLQQAKKGDGKQVLTGGTLVAEAAVDLKKKTIVKSRVRAQKIELGPFAALTPQLRELAGRLEMDISAEGPFAQPQPRGKLSISGGRLRLRGTSAYDRLAVDLQLTPSEVNLTRLSLHSGNGNLVASAKLALDKLQPQRFSLDARLRKFTIGVAPVADGVFSGKITVRGEFPSKHELVTHVRIDEGALKLGEIETSRSLHDTSGLVDVVFVDEAARKARAKLAKRKARGDLPLTIKVDLLADPLMVRGEQLDVESAIGLKVSIVEGVTRIRGKVELRRGSIKILSNKYDVKRAIVRFSAEKKPNPALDVQITRRFGDALILITVRGTARKPELTLSSDPPIYDRSQIISLIVTGRIDPRKGGEKTDNSLAVASAVSQALIGSITRSIAPKVGIDVARVNLGQSKDEKGETKLRAEAEVGKYITERLYVAYRRVFGASAEENANEGLLEFRLTARWMLVAVFGDAGIGGIDLLWNYRY